MKNFIFNNKINFLFFLVALGSTLILFGFDFISITNTQWIHHTTSDLSQSHIGWYFFKNDIWRFPLGSNPNYGDEFGNSIIFSDSIPLLALFFKLINPVMPENFHYFSIWYFLCFLLQIYFSNKILFKFTKDKYFSFVGSLFFLLAPIFILRMSLHPALAGQWLLLITLYLCLTQSYNVSKYNWIFIISIASLIHWYFTVIISIVFFLLRSFSFFFNKEKIFSFIKDLAITFLPLLTVMYIVGYFEVRTVDGLGLGYGSFKLNLLSIIDSTISFKNESWSWILKDIKLPDAEDLEGFNYLGFGQILLVLLGIFTLLKNRNTQNLNNFINDNKIKIFFWISLILTFLALSNKISFGPYSLIEIPLNKYIYAGLSLMRSSGRLFWIVNYFFIVFFLIIIFKSYNIKISSKIITILFLIQIIDISAGLKNYISLNTLTKNNYILKDNIWSDITKEFKIVKTTYPDSYNPKFVLFSDFYEKYSIKKTNLIKIARANRSLIAEARYKLYQQFNDEKLDPKTIYIAGNLGHLKHLKKIYKDKNVGFFYRDNIWIVLKNKKALMNNADHDNFKKIKPDLLKVGKEEILNFNNKGSYLGFGWSHNFTKSGIWSDGKIATLLFTTNTNENYKILEIDCEPYLTKKNKILNVDIYINNEFNKNVQFNKTNDLNKKKIKIEIGNETKNNEFKIDFHIKNPISPLEVFQSPDSRKLGILLKSIKLKSI